MLEAIAFSLILSVSIAYLFHKLNQPLMVAYILSGILLGPLFLNILPKVEVIEELSHIGVALLLFLVGVKLNPYVLKSMGKDSLLVGLGQIISSFLLGFILALFFAHSLLEASIMALAMTFSSTILAVKLLSDSKEIDRLFGRIAVGVLIIQDLVFVVSLSFLTNFPLIEILAKALFLILTGLVVKFLVDKLIKEMASSLDLLFAFSVSYALAFSYLSSILGLPMEIGALLAGITLSKTPFVLEIESRVRPLRDFFILLFFLYLGSSLSGMGNISFLEIASYSLLVSFGTPIIVFLIMILLHHTPKNALYTGLAISQMSEFSFILLFLAHNLGLISTSVATSLTVVGMMSMGISAYLFKYKKDIWNMLRGHFPLNTKSNVKAHSHEFDAVVFGFEKMGKHVVEALIEKGFKPLIVDYNPSLSKSELPIVFGDASDVEFLDEINVGKAKVVISAVHDFDANRLIVEYVRRKNPKATVVVTSMNEDEGVMLYDLGADYVVIPHHISGRHLAELIRKDYIKRHGKKHREDLSKGANRG